MASLDEDYKDKGLGTRRIRGKRRNRKRIRGKRGKKTVRRERQRACFYITVDFATAASQNGFHTYKLFLHKKTNINQKIRFLITFIFYDTFFYLHYAN
jgi:hypothetical protein